MKLRKLMAIKSHRYGTRHLTAGEEYEVPHGHAIALVAVKKARFADKLPARAVDESKPEPVAMPQLEPEPEPGVDTRPDDPPSEFYAGPMAEPESTEARIDRLRMEATQLGINVDRRWGVARLQHEIAQARR